MLKDLPEEVKDKMIPKITPASESPTGGENIGK
jgi:hypothetical protein